MSPSVVRCPIKSRFWRSASRAMLLACAGLLTGCGDAANQRVAVEGTVTRGGQPVIGGALNMVPEAETKGPAVSAVIRDGKVNLTTEDGPFPGKYKVILRSDSADAFRRDGQALESQPEAPNPEGSLELTVEKSPEITVEFTAGTTNQTVFAF